MFCKNCGKELESGENFCSRCGTKAEEKKAIADAHINNALVTGLGRLGESKIVFFASVLLQIISVFLLGQIVISANYEIYYYTSSVEITLFEEKEFLKTLFILGYLLAIVLMLLPILTNKRWGTKNFAVGIAMPVLVLILFVATVVLAKKEVVSNEYYELLKNIDFSIEITEYGWGLILASVMAGLLTYKACNDVQVEQERYRREKEQNPLVEIDMLPEEDIVVCEKCGRKQKKGSAFCESCYTPFFKMK